MPVLLSVNVGRPRPNPDKSVDETGIDKRPWTGRCRCATRARRRPGSAAALSATSSATSRTTAAATRRCTRSAREDLDAWEQRLGRALTNGFFGENLTTSGIDVNAALVGERWQLGDTVVVEVTYPRIPCSTFRGWVGEQGWLKTFTEVSRPGAYLRIVVPGEIRAGDAITVVHRPDHGETITQAYRRHMFGAHADA